MPVYASLAAIQLDTSDSFFRIEADLSPSVDLALGEPGFNPATGGMAMNAASPPIMLRVFLEGGYLASGETILQGALLADGVTDPQPDDPVGFRFVDNALTLFDRRGWAVSPSPEELADVESVLAPLGSIRDLVFDLAGGEPGGGGGGGTQFSRSDEGSPTKRRVEIVRGERRLVGVSSEVRRTVSGRLALARHELSIRHLSAKRNADRDRVRSARRGATGHSESGMGFNNCPPMFSRGSMNSCSGGNPGGTPPGGPNCDAFRVWDGVPSASVNLVLQHGIWSDACTWQTARPALLAAFPFGVAVESRTGHQEGYWAQQQQLRSGLETVRGGREKFVFVGHSQGGVIARLAAQQLPASMVRGVVTLHSPNNGTLVAEPARQASAAAVTGRAIALLPGLRPLGPFVAGIGALAPLVDDFRCDPSRAAVCDARPGSGILQQVNAVATPFRTVAIVGHARHDLVLVRLVGDFADPRGGGGRSAVRRVQRCRVYCTGLGVLLQFVPVYRGYGSLLIGAVGTVTALDLAWRGIYANGGGGDGFINAAGQPAYGDSVTRIVVSDADSHVGAQYGVDRGVEALRRAIRRDLGLAERTP